MVTTRQTQAATTALNASQIRRSVIFGRPHAHPSRKDNAYGPLQFPTQRPLGAAKAKKAPKRDGDHGCPCRVQTKLASVKREGAMAIPVTTIGGAGALHEAVRKHPEYAFILEYCFILALVCLLLGL